MTVENGGSGFVAEVAEFAERAVHLISVTRDQRQAVFIHIRFRVTGITGHYKSRALGHLNTERLMARRVPMRGKQHQRAVAKEVEFTIHRLVVQLVIPILRVEIGLLVEFRVACRLQFILLHENGGLGKELVPATVVEMEMGVDDILDVIGSELELGELANNFFSRL